MRITRRLLEQVALHASDSLLHARPVEIAQFQTREYFGFTRARFPDIAVKVLAHKFGLEPEDLQIEIVHIPNNFGGHIYSGSKSSVVLMPLYQAFHFPAPRKCRMYVRDSWHPVSETDDMTFIPSGTPYGFHSDADGEMYLLLIQSPPVIY